MVLKIARSTSYGYRADSAPSHALDREGEHVVHLDGLVGEVRLGEAGADQRSVVGILRLDQAVEVLARGKDLPGVLGAIELARIAADGRHFPCELRRDVHDERRLYGVFAVGEGVENLVRPMGLARGGVACKSCEEAGI